MRISDWSSDVCSSDLVLRHAFVHPAKLLGRRLGLVFRFPFGLRHAIFEGARLVLRHRAAVFMGSVQHPVGQAVAAKAAAAHKIDILHVRPVPKVAAQPPEGGSRQYVVNRLFFCHFLASLVDLSSFRFRARPKSALSRYHARIFPAPSTPGSDEITSERPSLMRNPYA